MRRDSSDKAWKQVKEEVQLRDKGVCRLAKALSIQEYVELRREAGGNLGKLDPAHYLSVSDRPDLCYEPNNIVLLNHYSHSLLDDFKHPITGKPINSEEQQQWWLRILKTNPAQYKWLENNGLIGE